MGYKKGDRVLRLKAKNLKDFIDKIESLPVYIAKLVEKYHEFSWDAYVDEYVYRGHGHEKWELTPSIYRKENYELYNYLFGIHADQDFSKPHSMCVEHIVNRFSEEASNRGLYVPGYSNKIKNKHLIEQYKPIDLSVGTDQSHRVALVQHYNLPTPFLDWSKNPLVACYFATKYAINLYLGEQLNEKPSSITVWALNIRRANYDYERYDEILKPGVPPFIIHDVPRYGNSNMVAQKGVFSYWSKMFDEENQKIYAMDSLDLCPKLICELPMLVRIDLEIKYVYQLVRYLQNRDIEASTVFPGYYGVAESIKEEALLNKFYDEYKLNNLRLSKSDKTEQQISDAGDE